jgi:hypothetical protein
MTNLMIALVQLGQHMCNKSMQRNLTGYEILCYEQLCRFSQEYAKSLQKVLERSNNEGASETERRGS